MTRQARDIASVERSWPYGLGQTWSATRSAYAKRSQSPELARRLAAYLSQRWAVEFETWMRASNPECCSPRRTEMLYSVSVVRVLASEGIQPYMLGGLTLLQADHSELQIQIGVER